MSEIEFAVTIDGRRYRAEPSRRRSIAVPWPYSAAGAHFFDAPPPRNDAMVSADFDGRVATGASCNVSALTLISHCHGTHTEGIGHLTVEQHDVRDRLPTGFVVAWLGTIAPVPAGDCADEHHAGIRDDDPVLPDAALAAMPLEKAPALVFRTRRGEPLAFASRRDFACLTRSAAGTVSQSAATHLLIDTPSLDRLDDAALPNHRHWWRMPAGSTSHSDALQAERTVTEMLDIPRTLTDGWYLLDLRAASLPGDAVPSTPWLYPLTPA